MQLAFLFLSIFQKASSKFHENLFYQYFLYASCFLCLKKNLCISQHHKDFLFFSRSFMVLASTMRPMIKLNFCGWCKLRVNVHFPPYGQLFDGKTSFFNPLKYLGMFVENNLAKYRQRYFHIPCSIQLICVSVISPTPQFFHYCSFIISLEIR